MAGQKEQPMPFRLIWYIIVLVFIFIFIGLNLGNTSDINLWFSESARLTDVPIFISFFVMYIFGALSVIPLCHRQWLEEAEED